MKSTAYQLLSLFKQLIGSKGRAYFVPTDTEIEQLSIAIDTASDGIGNATIGAPGTGYAPGDIGYIFGGAPEAMYKVLTINGGTGVRSFEITFTGFNYTIASGVGTLASTGGGIGFTVNIHSLLGLGTTQQLVRDGYRLLDSCIPDNDNFSDGTLDPNDNDCNDWERRWGLKQWGVTNVPLTPTRLQRMAAISQKMRYPGTNAPRQSARYLQDSLQAAGFPVYVYENLSNLSPDDVFGLAAGASNLGGFDLGESDLGQSWGGTVIANSVDEVVDSEFVIPDPNFHGTFFISGSPITTFADIPAIQKVQFRQLILNLKPAHMAGFLAINYV